MEQGRASRTAVVVCQARAAADGRLAVGRFADPVAARLLRPDESGAVDQVRLGQPPTGWQQRLAFETVRASTEVIVPRTVAIDDALRAHQAPQLVLLGAGLDDRAWRMSELAGTDVFEVDHPASQADKQARIGDLAAVARSVTFVPADLTVRRLDDALTAAGFRPDVATTWIWEGVIPYLDRRAVTATMHVISVLAPAGSRIIVNYQSPSALAWLGRLAARAMSAGRSNPFAGEPIRSTWAPSELGQLLLRYGFAVAADDNLLTLAEGLDMSIRERLSLRTGRVAVADR
jgi:methyltransferase (TIGR00027 family)